MSEIKNILVPTDFSDHSDYALRRAVELANRYDAQIHLVYVLEKMPGKLGEIMKTDPVEWHQDVEKSCEPFFEAQVSKLSEKPSTQIITAVKKGTPFRRLLKYEKKMKIDLIVISSQGESAIEEVLFGATSTKIVRYAECDTFVVKKPKY